MVPRPRTAVVVVASVVFLLVLWTQSSPAVVNSVPLEAAAGLPQQVAEAASQPQAVSARRRAVVVPSETDSSHGDPTLAGTDQDAAPAASSVPPSGRVAAAEPFRGPAAFTPSPASAEVAADSESARTGPLVAQVLPKDDALEATLVRHIGSRWDPSSPRDFETVYDKVPCGAIVTNLCVWNGQPRYFREGQTAFTKSAATLMCNEAGSKHRFPMLMHPPIRRAELTTTSSAGGGLPMPDGRRAPLHRKSLLVVPYCWEQYGYHLFLCLQATYAQLQRVGVGDHAADFATIYVAALKGGGFTKWFGGGNGSWFDAAPEPAFDADGKLVPVDASSYWGLWSAIAPHPWSVRPAPALPRACFANAIVGGPPSNDLLPAESREWRLVVLQRLGMARTRPARTCNQMRAVILQRKKNFFVRDVDAVAASVRKAFGADSASVEIVSLEDLTFRQQLQLALDADLLIGVHGNGLTWLTFMQPGLSAAVELWPHHPYNGNYDAIAKRANVRLFSSTGDGQCGNRCSANYDFARLHAVLAQAVTALKRAHCQGDLYDVEAEYLRQRADAKARKEAKRKAKARAGSG